MTYISSCKIGSTHLEFTDYIDKYPLYQGDTYSIPNSPYSVKIITLDYNTYGEPYSTIALLKNGIEINRDTCYPFAAECNYLHDNNICISHGSWDYADAPYKVGIDAYYNGYTHLECESGICTQVTGIGTNTCTTIGNTTQCRHLECESGICTELLIPGTNTCATIGSTTECATTSEITDIEVGYKVPWIYPKAYVDGVLYVFKQDFDKEFADQGYPNYKVQTTVYDETTHIITITIKKTYTLSKLDNSNINILLAPIVWGVVLIAGALVGAWGLYNLFLFGSKQIFLRDASASAIYTSRTIRVNALVTGTSGDTIPLNADWMVSFYSRYGGGPLINMEYPISAGTSYFEISLNEGFTTALSVTSNNLVHNKSPTDLTINDKGNQVINVIFKSSVPVQEGTVNPLDSDNNPITCGRYIANYSESGTLIGEGSLQTDGKTSILKAIPNLKAYIVIVSCDETQKITSLHFITPSTPWSLDVLIKNCDEAKNTLTVTLQRKQISGAYEFPLPDSVHVIHPSGKILDLISGTHYIPGTDVAVVCDGFEIGTHIVKIVRKDSTIITDTKPVTFDTNCFSSQSLVFDAEPISKTVDLSIEVIKFGTSNTISDVNVYIDADTIGYNNKLLITNNVGVTPYIYGLTYGNHKITLKRNGYKNITYDLIADSLTPLIKTYTMNSEDQIGTISTSITLKSNPSGDLIPNTEVKFEGELAYLNSDGSVKGLLENGSINVLIKDGTTIVKQYNGLLTDPRLSLSPGSFRTPTWLIPKSLAKKDLEVTAEFNGGGDYKASSTTQTFYVTEGCCYGLPYIGCLISQDACDTAKTASYVIVGGVVIYLGYNIYSSMQPPKQPPKTQV